MRGIRLVRRVARVVLAALLYGQAALAVSACQLPERSAAEAIAQNTLPPCHQSDTKADNLCVAHCLGEYQSLDRASLPVAAMIDAPALLVAWPAAPHANASCAVQAVQPGCGPPPRILFQSLLI